MSQSPQTSPHGKSGKPYWLLILIAILAPGGLAVALVKVPELRCALLRLSCPPAFQNVTLYTQTGNGELLGGVEITVFGSDGAPETTQTDDNGYAQVRIANKGVVRVNLSKSGYPPQNTTIDLKNQQDTVRTIRFSESGQPEVIASSTSPPSPPSSTNPVDPSNAVVTAVENQFMKMELTGISKNQDGEIRLGFVIINKTGEDLYLGLNWQKGGGTITDNFGQVCGNRGLEGLTTVNSSASKPDDFSQISPDSRLVVGQIGCRFPTSEEFNASFPLVRYQPSTTNPAGEQTKFSVGFTGLKLP